MRKVYRAIVCDRVDEDWLIKTGWKEQEADAKTDGSVALVHYSVLFPSADFYVKIEHAYQ